VEGPDVFFKTSLPSQAFSTDF